MSFVFFRLNNMKKIVLFNLVCVQAKKWAKYHGGAENDFTVFQEVLREIGNQPDWEVYGYFMEGRTFSHDINSLLSSYNNLKLISSKALDKMKQTVIFYAIYSSDINGLKWIFEKKLRSKKNIIVIHGLRRYELQTHLFDLLLPNRFSDKLFVLKSFFAKKLLKNNIEKYHRKLFAGISKTINPKAICLIATSTDTYYKLLAMCPDLSRSQISMLYTSPKTLTTESLAQPQEELILKKYALESKKYFLLISLGRIEKNIFFALENLQRLSEEYSLPFKIFVCGESKQNWIINAFKKKANVKIAGYIPGEDLRILYKHAFLFVYPTRTEGFGMPLLEAMQYGTPVCCTALSPLIEVGGEAAEYFSLNNDLEFRSKIIKFYFDVDFYKEKSCLSLARYHKIFSLQMKDLKRKKDLILNDVDFENNYF